MPANLTQQYHRAEQAYRRAATADDELRCLMDMLRELPKHKGTDKLQAHLKQKISAAKRVCETLRSSKKKGPGLRIPRQGAGRVVLLGGPNAGKSQFVRQTTKATPDVQVYPFTTREVTPAMMPFEDISFQLVDTPPVTKDVFATELQGLIRGADLVLLFVDLSSDEGWGQAQDVIRQTECTRTRLAATSFLDAADIGLSFTQTLLVLNKVDLGDAALRWELIQETKLPPWQKFHISARTGDGIAALQQGIFAALNIARVYTKSPTEKVAVLENPFIVRGGGTVYDVAAQVHGDFPTRLKSARLWHREAADSINVKGDHVVKDQDVVEFLV